MYTYIGAPESPHDCSVVNQTTINLIVECEAGYNGSLFQIFHMEIYDLIVEHLEQNLTTVDKPIFKVNGLTPGISYLMVIYSSNAKGKSESVALMVSIPLPAKKRIGNILQIIYRFIYLSIFTYIYWFQTNYKILYYYTEIKMLRYKINFIKTHHFTFVKNFKFVTCLITNI